MTEWSWLSLAPLYPEVFLAAAGLVLLLVGAFRGNSSLKFILTAVVAAIGITMVMIAKADWATITTFDNMVVQDGFSAWMKLLILGGLAVSIIMSYDWLRENSLIRFEFPLLILFSGVGMLLMVSANNLLSLYVSLELSSLCLYVLASIRRDTITSAEAGIKYFILGALSSGLLLFGISLIYGYTGSIDYTVIGNTLLAHQGDVATGAVLGLVFVLAGLAFKVSAVPFHMWTPDVYQGAPTPVTALFAIVPKVAALGLIVRLLVQPFASLEDDWMPILILMAVASMAWGSFAGIAQENIKRLLAYSSIANMGFAIIGLIAGIPEGIAALVLYVAIYMVMTAGTFAIILNLKRDGRPIENITDFAGLSKSAPVAAFTLAALMFSMSGIPPLAGFFSKLFIFQAAVETGHYIVAVLGVLASVVGSYYYLRIIKVMYFDDGVSVDKASSKLCLYIGILALIFTLVFCAVPMSLLEASQQAAGSLFAK